MVLINCYLEWEDYIPVILKEAPLSFKPCTLSFEIK